MASLSFSDLLTCFGMQLIPMINQKPAINKLLNEGKHSRNKRTKTLTTWALRQIKQLQGDATGSKCVCHYNNSYYV